MKATRLAGALAFVMVICPVEAALAQARTKAEVTCRPTGHNLQYDCTIMLMNARTGEPLSDVTLTVGADMPSMPMMHNVRPAKASPGEAAGTYQVRLELEMRGDWAIQLNMSGPLHDRVVSILRFERDRVIPAPPNAAPGHRH